MKKLVLVLWFLLVTSYVYAAILGEPEGCSGLRETTYQAQERSFKQHTHCYEDTDTDTNSQNKERSDQGFGVDLVLWESEDKEVEVSNQYKYDWANGSHSNYIVTKVNLWQKVKRLFSDD